MSVTHRTVLLGPAVELLALQPGHVVVDGTTGGGGHSEAILARTGPDGLVVGIDRDPEALARATQRLAAAGERFIPVAGSFGSLASLAAPWAPVDGVLLDLGVSAFQFDQAARGFSLQHDGPVDMRMDPTCGQTAADLIDDLDEAALAQLLRDYGEEPRARRIARALVAGRPWSSTRALASCVASSSGYRNSRTHPATRTFQALRIAVNDELGELERGLAAALQAVRPGGRVVVISFHSLEDRLVKQCFRRAAGRGTARDAYGQPVDAPLGRLVVPKGISGRDADPDNPRARSARVRAFERTLPLPSPA